MTELIWAVIAVAWLVCGVVGAGYFYAHVQRHYPGLAAENRAAHTRMALLHPLLSGPIGLFASWLCGFYSHGWLWPGTVDPSLPSDKR